MNPKFKKAIEESYNLTIKNALPASRQFVAETYILEDTNGQKYFCKIVDKTLFIPGIIKALPIAEEMHINGIEKISYPIRGNKDLYLLIDGSLIFLLNYIEAKQSFDYDSYELGKEIAKIHAITPKIKSEASKDSFDFLDQELFEDRLKSIFDSDSNDVVLSKLKNLLLQHQDEIENNKEVFLRLSKKCKENMSGLVLTHGDLSTNVLVKSPKDFYIIDWDEIRLGPAERDLWMIDEREGFVDGYKSVRKDFIVDKHRYNFCILQYYFERMNYYFSDILNESLDLNFRIGRVEKLSQGRLAGWILPKVEEATKSIP